MSFLSGQVRGVVCVCFLGEWGLHRCLIEKDKTRGPYQ